MNDNVLNYGRWGIDAAKATNGRALRRIFANCEIMGDCWIWKPSVNSSGYPQARMGGEPKMVRNYLYTTLLGRTVPEGMRLSALCDNKRCCSPLCLLPRTESTTVARDRNLVRRRESGNKLELSLRSLGAPILAGASIFAFATMIRDQANRPEIRSIRMAKSLCG
jgi:hypothetical protein